MQCDTVTGECTELPKASISIGALLPWLVLGLLIVGIWIGTNAWLDRTSSAPLPSIEPPRRDFSHEATMEAGLATQISQDATKIVLLQSPIPTPRSTMAPTSTPKPMPTTPPTWWPGAPEGVYIIPAPTLTPWPTATALLPCVTVTPSLFTNQECRG